MLIIVYGTLRKGEALSEYMETFASKCPHTMEVIELKGISIHILGDVPGAKLDPKSSAVVELWEFTVKKYTMENILCILDQVEGVEHGLYKRSYVYTTRGKAIIYTYCGSVKGMMKIKDWTKWNNSATKQERLESLKALAGSENYVILQKKSGE